MRIMGKLDHGALAAHRAGHGGAPLFQSLKQVWLSSLAPPDLPYGAGAPGAQEDPVPDIVIVSRPPPARVLP